jgi:lipoprotein-releasing system ATP-binding protein
MNKKFVINCSALCKTFAEGGLYVEVLRGINFHVSQGEMVAVVGPSGSGKSTLLHILGGLEKPSGGLIKICGHEMTALSERAKGELRNKYLGFVYQFHHLLPEFSALENVAIPLLLGNASVSEAEEKAAQLLGQLGLGNRLRHRAGELSGGERQRVAIARALITKPQCVLADEPTGNLDHKNAMHIYELIMHLNHELGTAFVIVSHDLSVTKMTQRTVTICDGVLQE